MDQRGQISVEFVLMAAIIMLVVVVFGLSIANENELNSVATAVKTGAENATTYLSISNASMQPVRVTSVNMNGTNNVIIKVSFSGNVTSIQQNILTSINRSLTSQGFNTTYTGGTQLTFQTSRHNYTISLV
jgi:uncharacterized protein (UPF0333 family)